MDPFILQPCVPLYLDGEEICSPEAVSMGGSSSEWSSSIISDTPVTVYNFHINDFTQVDYDAIDSTVRSSINPAVFRGNLETILPAEHPLPINERPRREDDVIFVSAHQENCREIRFKTEAVIENIQTPPQRKEEEDDVIFVTAYQENCRKIRFKSEDERIYLFKPPLQTIGWREYTYSNPRYRRSGGGAREYTNRYRKSGRGSIRSSSSQEARRPTAIS
ncbi:uncharacterized protein LOC120433026 [Oreochromis aureus]|uniref:uncharacterized protein LOC120433026 n=1 Tax=Oreochromis aureus TaxID=47969 RepID=UPI001953E09B|nr:uncharacterized protein LOC120433026 [Oreochromis aureus]CAI5685430.1 unnamed protein product [Mustela putorius furo]